MNNDFNDLLQDALDMSYEEKINLTKEAVDKLYNVLITNNKDEAMPDMLKIFGYFIKLDNIIAFDEIQLLIYFRPLLKQYNIIFIYNNNLLIVYIYYH